VSKVKFDAAAKSAGSLQAGLFGPGPDGGQKFGARRDNWSQPKPVSEVEATKRFSAFTDAGLTDLEKVEDDADVIARTPGGVKVEFQVTVLWDEDFWRWLNTTGATQDGYKSSDEMNSLILKAIERKSSKYTPSRLRVLNLLIDTNPVPVIPTVAVSARKALRPRLSETGFNSIWLVGAERQHTYQLWPIEDTEAIEPAPV